MVLCAGLLLSACAGSVLDTTPSENPIPTTTPEVTIAEVVTPTTLSPAAPRVYVVAAGDTLSGIAERFGTTSADIIELNEMADPDNLSIGDELLVPAPKNDSELFAPEDTLPPESSVPTE
ncbi:MAG: LysM peptidoglycan-binding domain-containing protein [Acidimicrobiales bacterium]